MFDIGFWELMTVAIVALLVVGPERLPQLARDAGRWVRAIRRFINQTRYEIERELEIDADKELERKIGELGRLSRFAPDLNEPGETHKGKDQAPGKDEESKSS
jgi:sec-independent protein translocase protein TatB